MKNAYKVLLLFTISFVLITSTNALYSFPNSQNSVPHLNAVVSTPPVIIFNLTNMSSTGILLIQVYDAETNLYEVNVFWNGVVLNDSETWFTVTWDSIVYDSSNTPLSVQAENSESSFDNLAPGSDNTYIAEIFVDDVFLPGDHNNISVVAENLGGAIATSTTSFCNTVDCWGRGGGSSTAETPANTIEQTGIPTMIFDMTGYYCCGYVEPIIEPNGNPIVNFTVFYNETKNMLAMTVLTENGYFYKSAIFLDYSVDLNLFGCRDCSCPIEEPEPTNTSGYLIMTILSSVLIVTTIVNLRKRKSKK
ncbi:MAG: hypothetical protein KGD64_10695 [Candidatus Heimdallarchaeota archaeon]|nr:hypothetical protein [Candidatus Heimdallarchaeota archaeon]